MDLWKTSAHVHQDAVDIDITSFGASFTVFLPWRGGVCAYPPSFRRLCARNLLAENLSVRGREFPFVPGPSPGDAPRTKIRQHEIRAARINFCASRSSLFPGARDSAKLRACNFSQIACHPLPLPRPPKPPCSRDKENTRVASAKGVPAVRIGSPRAARPVPLTFENVARRADWDIANPRKDGYAGKIEICFVDKNERPASGIQNPAQLFARTTVPVDCSSCNIEYSIAALRRAAKRAYDGFTGNCHFLVIRRAVTRAPASSQRSDTYQRRSTMRAESPSSINTSAIRCKHRQSVCQVHFFGPREKNAPGVSSLLILGINRHCSARDAGESAQNGRQHPTVFSLKIEAQFLGAPSSGRCTAQAREQLCEPD